MTSRHTLANPTYEPQPLNPSGYKTFNDFYPFYLGEHSQRRNRRLHILGTTISVFVLPYAITNKKWSIVAACFLQGYFFAWIGHFFIEKNRPATFKHPLYSFIGDCKLWLEVVTGKRAF